jgi:hypothetical protein
VGVGVGVSEYLRLSNYYCDFDIGCVLEISDLDSRKVVLSLRGAHAQNVLIFCASLCRLSVRTAVCFTMSHLCDSCVLHCVASLCFTVSSLCDSCVLHHVASL